MAEIAFFIAGVAVGALGFVGGMFFADYRYDRQSER